MSIGPCAGWPPPAGSSGGSPAASAGGPRGRDHDPEEIGGVADRLNNVENVYVADAASGTWTVTVAGFNVPLGPQPFALVVEGTGEPAPNTPPAASFTSSCTDLSCSFADASTDTDGSVTSWSWDFGDEATSTAQNPSHTYAAGGTYTVTLTMTGR